MTTIPIGTFAVKFDCPRCGPTALVLSNVDSDDSTASCDKCGVELGSWPDVRKDAVLKAAAPSIQQVARDLVKDALKNFRLS